MDTKACKRCSKDKPLRDFHRDQGMKGGLRNICKPCACQIARDHQMVTKCTEEGRKRLRAINLKSRQSRREDLRQRARAYARQHPDRVKASQSRVDPRKRRASGLLRMAVYDGRITKPDRCSECQWIGRVHGHHDDYSKPFEVVWLCAICHGKRHRKDKPGVDSRP